MADIKNNNAAPAFGEQNKHEALILKYKNVIIGGLVAIVAGIAIGFFVPRFMPQKIFKPSPNEVA